MSLAQTAFSLETNGSGGDQSLANGLGCQPGWPVGLTRVKISQAFQTAYGGCGRFFWKVRGQALEASWQRWARNWSERDFGSHKLAGTHLAEKFLMDVNLYLGIFTRDGFGHLPDLCAVPFGQPIDKMAVGNAQFERVSDPFDSGLISKPKTKASRSDLFREQSGKFGCAAILEIQRKLLTVPGAGSEVASAGDVGDRDSLGGEPSRPGDSFKLRTGVLFANRAGLWFRHFFCDKSGFGKWGHWTQMPGIGKIMGLARNCQASLPIPPRICLPCYSGSILRVCWLGQGKGT
jgi:hypothetical protein